MCVPVAAGRPYVWGFSMYFPDPNRVAGLSEYIAIYDGPGCTGANIGGYSLPIIGVPGIWFGGTFGLFPTPAGARSLRAGFGGLGGAINQATAYVDDVFVAPIKKGSTAPQAAGAIHTDFERGFIAAEVVDYNDLISAGSLTAAKSAGKVRTEGKGYIMKPNDVVEFKFNV